MYHIFYENTKLVLHNLIKIYDKKLIKNGSTGSFLYKYKVFNQNLLSWD